MRFTKYNSMKDILAYPQMREYLHVFYSEYLFEMYPEETYHFPIARVEQIAKTPWEEPFSIIADQLMDAVNLVLDLKENHTRRALSLWNQEKDANSKNQFAEWTLEKNARGGKDAVALITPEYRRQEKEKKIRPAVIICPGGGYEEVCFSGEGTPIMNFMEANGYVAFMLKYRVGRDGVYPAPQEDLAKAIRYVREHAEEYGLDPENVMVLGGSAGGHLCASEAMFYERPDKITLCYPVISLEKEAHEGSAKALTGGKKELRTALSVEHLVRENYPPTFLWTCADDDCVPPSNTVRMGEALERAGGLHEMHVYPSGGHGCALAFSKSACDWSQEMLRFFERIK